MITISVKGLDTLKAKMKKKGGLAGKAMRQTVSQLATHGKKLTVNEIVNGVPRTGRLNKAKGYNRSAIGEPLKTDSGALAKSIQRHSSGLRGWFGTSLFYGVEWELGDGVPPRPFLLPVSHMVEQDAIAFLRENMKKAGV